MTMNKNNSYGKIIIDLNSYELSEVEKLALKSPSVGGVILFTKNFKSKKQVKNLIKDIRAKAHNELLICVDHEGGRVWRFEEGFTKTPSASFLASEFEENKISVLSKIKESAEIISKELKEIGVDLSFAPVVDVDHGISTVMDGRMYSNDPDVVTSCVEHFIKGYNKYQMPSVGKHFPGHGGCVNDTHFELAEDNRKLKDILNLDVLPYSNLKDSLDAIMMSHVVYSKVDIMPASFSSIWIQDILRKHVGFNGLVVSDCLSMKATDKYGSLEQKVELAFVAGCDMVIASNCDYNEVINLLDNNDYSASGDSLKRITKVISKSVSSNQIFSAC